MKHLLYFTKQIHAYSGKILYFNLLSMMFIGLLEGVGIFLLIPLIGLTGIMDVDSHQIPFLNWLTGFFQRMPGDMSLIFILSIYVLLLVGQSLFKRNQAILGAKIQQGFMRHLREDTYKSILGADWSFFLRKRKSDLVNMMTNETYKVGAGVQLFLSFIASFIFTIIQIGVAFYLSPAMTGSVLLFGALLILASRTFRKKSHELGQEAFQLHQTYMAGMTDHFNGMKDIKSNSLEDVHWKWFRRLSADIEKNRVSLTTLNTTSQAVFKIVSAFLIAGFAYFSIKMFAAQAVQLMLILLIFSRLWPQVTSIQSNLEMIQQTIPSFRALLKLQEECAASREMEGEGLHASADDVEPLVLREGMRCEEVYFRYRQSEERYALKEITVDIPARKMTAITGHSGAGKSTLIDLLMGLNKPDRGQVLIDGEPLAGEKLLSLRKSISYVPQDPFLFNATIRENLQIIDEKATDEDMWEALEFAAAADFVRRLPDGLDTVIGDRGIRLSGGERQRLVLARAILRKPSILILDEATSSLDLENEAIIQKAIDGLKGKMTILVIAHRLSTIQNADQVLFMEQGQIVHCETRNIKEALAAYSS